MSKPERQLRLMQVGCILLVAACIFVSYVGWQKKTRVINAGQWLVIVATIWSAVSGCTIQRRIVRGASRSQRLSGRSTPFTRWRAGNFVRLWGGMSVGLWAFVLHMIGGPHGLLTCSLRSVCFCSWYGVRELVQPQRNSYPRGIRTLGDMNSQIECIQW